MSVRQAEETDLLEMAEGQAFMALPSFSSGSSFRHFRSTMRVARSECATCWPESVKYLLRTYATRNTIREAFKALRHLKQLANEDDLEFSSCLHDAVSPCGGMHSESEEISMFIDGLAPAVRPIVARFLESSQRK